MKNIETSIALHIRMATDTTADIDDTVAMIRGLAVYEKLEHLMAATPDSIRDALFGPRPVAEVLLAHSGPDCIGFALFFETFCSVLGRRGCFMDNLFIVPEWRHMGVGEALMQRLAAIAVERHYARLEWMVVNWNKSAICFYEAQGASFMDDWTKCRMDEGAIRSTSGKKHRDEKAVQ